MINSTFEIPLRNLKKHRPCPNETCTVVGPPLPGGVVHVSSLSDTALTPESQRTVSVEMVADVHKQKQFLAHANGMASLAGSLRELGGS